MSEHTATVALQTLVATDLDDETLGMEMFALDEALGFDYERWCRVLGVDPDDPAIFAQFCQIHAGYTQTWSDMGQQAFHHAISPLVEKWSRILGVKR